MTTIFSLIANYETRNDSNNIKSNSILNSFRKWTKMYPDKNIDYKKISSLLRKETALCDTNDDIQQLYLECITRDIITVMKACFSFYTKKHKITMNESDTTLIDTMDISTLDSVIAFFRQTIGPIEQRYEYFTCRNKHRKKTASPNNAPKKLGEFNLFVKTQWANRKEELTALCKDGKGSSSVMKKLAEEWKQVKINKNVAK